MFNSERFPRVRASISPLESILYMKTYDNVSNIVAAYLNGEEEGLYGSLSFKDENLYMDKRLIAKKSDAAILVANNLTDEVNDALLVSTVKEGKNFLRVGSFSDLLSPTKRLEDFRQGRLDKLIEIGKTFGKTFSLAAYNLIAKKDKAESEYNAQIDVVNKRFADAERALREQHEAELGTLRSTWRLTLDPIRDEIDETETEIVTFFDEKRREEQDARKKLELAALDATTREAIEKWDNGEKMTDKDIRYVKGQGGGQRLRVIRSGSRDDVIGSDGQRTSLNLIRQGFNKLAPYAFGNQEMANDYYRNRYNEGYHVNVGSIRGYDVGLDNKGGVRMGCQSLKKSELERFALSQGWPVDGTLATV